MTKGYERNKDLPKAGFAAGPCLVKDTMQLFSLWELILHWSSCNEY